MWIRNLDEDLRWESGPEIKKEKVCRGLRWITVRHIDRHEACGIAERRSKQYHNLPRAMIGATMICSQETIRKIGLRIERAYCRKYPQWISAGMTAGVWETAAKRLLEASEDKLGLPIDPEFFVAVQVRNRMSPNPWVELTQQGALLTYRKALRRIISRLKQELRKEIFRVERRLSDGADIAQVLEAGNSRISPLTCYLLARKAGRIDLSSRHHAAALNQHRSCPLYKIAARSLLPFHAYPSFDLAVEPSPTCQEMISFSRN